MQLGCSAPIGTATTQTRIKAARIQRMHHLPPETVDRARKGNHRLLPAIATPRPEACASKSDECQHTFGAEIDMSRLDSFIRRLEAQRVSRYAAAQIRGMAGPVLELGLGNGRTYDHLRELLPEREIFVFEREVKAHPDCIPDAAHLILGDVRTTCRRRTAAFRVRRCSRTRMSAPAMPRVMPSSPPGLPQRCRRRWRQAHGWYPISRCGLYAGRATGAGGHRPGALFLIQSSCEIVGALISVEVWCMRA